MTGAFCCAAARFMPDIVAASPSIRQQRDNALTHDWQCEGQCGSVERSYLMRLNFSALFLDQPGIVRIMTSLRI
jgi:hypothetical protein